MSIIGTAFPCDAPNDVLKKPHLQLESDGMTQNRFQYQFDFEIGYLIQSPCKTCERKETLPECAPTCRILDKIQSILVQAVSCTRRS